MARTTTYLNFTRHTEEAFAFYRSVFGTEYVDEPHRMGEMAGPGASPLSEADKNLIMHIELPILGGHVLMGTDAPESLGFTVRPGDNVHLNLEPDTRAEANRLFAALSVGGTVDQPLADMPWGGYYGSFADRFGIHWMINCREPSGS